MGNVEHQTLKYRQLVHSRISFQKRQTHLKEEGERHPLIVAVEGSVAAELIAQS